MEQLARRDIPEIIPKLSTWYPDITVGAESVFLQPEFYEELVALAGEEADRSFYAAVVRKEDELVGFVAAEYDEPGRTLYGWLGVVDPAHRGHGIGKILGAMFGEQLGVRIGAELLLTTATLKHQRTQRVLEGLGFELVGIVPAIDRKPVAPGVVKRLYEAAYAKVLVGPGEVLRPSPDGMTPRTAALMKHLFGG